MRLEKYIHQLLFQHDCVIVPKFGAFISHPTSATINPENFEIIPPQHEISFNSSLTSNDGLLERKYAQEQRLTVEKASENLNEDVEQWKVRLKNGESIVIDQIGSLKNNSEGVIEFNSESSTIFLPYNFGLEPIKPNLILNDTIQEDHEKSKRSWSSVLAVASVIPIIVGGYFYFNTPQPVQKFVDHQWSGIVLPAIKEAVPNLIDTDVQIEKEVAVHNLPQTIEDPLQYIKEGTTISLPEEATSFNDSVEDKILSKIEITVFEEKKINDTEKEVKAIIKNKPIETKATEVTTKEKAKEVVKTPIADKKVDKIVEKKDEVVKVDANPKKYQVIAASLRRPEDAGRMLKTLVDNGYKNASVVYVKGRFYYVTFDSFDSKEKATTYMNKIHNDKPEAWVREHK